MLRKIRRLAILAAFVAAPATVVVANPAQAVWCGPEDSASSRSCDCSVYVLKFKVLPCDN